MDELTQIGISAIDKNANSVRDIGQEIWRNPELGLQEFHAHKLLCDFFRENGFNVDAQFLGPSGFRATYGSAPAQQEAGAGPGVSGERGLSVCLLAEYDALPELGHASGHNLTTEACVATALGLKAVIDSKKGIGRVTVLGTPDTEGNGKKIEAIHNGFFKDVDLAVTFIPFTANVLDPVMLTIMRMTICYKGKAAHASSCPWDGRNALDAAVLCYNNISVLRQQLKPYMQIHGIISNGGLKPNIIPEQTELQFYLRARDHVDMAYLQQKANAAFKAAARATGCELEFNFTSTPYSNLCSNSKMCELYRDQAAKQGVEFVEDSDIASTLVGSSDVGNVSHVVPTIAPAFDIGSGPVTTNSQGFAEAAGNTGAHERTLVAAKAMCGALIQAMVDPTVMESVKSEFKESDCSATVTQWH